MTPRELELKHTLYRIEMTYQADLQSARSQYRGGHDPKDFPAFNAAMAAAEKQRAERIAEANRLYDLPPVAEPATAAPAITSRRVGVGR